MRLLAGEASSADPVNIHSAHELLPKLLRGVSAPDIYNTDETGVNYRTQPTRTLASQPRSGIKLAKDRVTAVLCVNATGSHKLPIMIIGSAKRPRCFPSGWRGSRAGIPPTSRRSLFSEYMTFFNGEMRSRGKTGWLLMDKSSTHGLPADAVLPSHMGGLHMGGFNCSNTNAIFLQIRPAIFSPWTIH